MSEKDKVQEEINPYYEFSTKNWRRWGSWFSWGSPVGLGLFFIETAIAVWILAHLV